MASRSLHSAGMTSEMNSETCISITDLVTSKLIVSGARSYPQLGTKKTRKLTALLHPARHWCAWSSTMDGRRQGNAGARFCHLMGDERFFWFATPAGAQEVATYGAVAEVRQERMDFRDPTIQRIGFRGNCTSCSPRGGVAIPCNSPAITRHCVLSQNEQVAHLNPKT